jgi:SSS family solute:Na+ symporter
MNWLDLAVLLVSLVGIALYGIWHTRHPADLDTYVKGKKQTPWLTIGLSVMATQASAITFLSTPGQGYLSGLGFVQIYFGVPIALLIISRYFLPAFHNLNIYTAYEYLEKRFDTKTRLLGAGLFLLQRGLGAGLTIYAPAIVLTSVCGWPLELTIISCGLLVIVYTVMGGSAAVNITQKYQLGIIFVGMLVATYLLIAKLPTGLTISDTMHLAGEFGKLQAIDPRFDLNERYTLWSGLIGGTFLMLSYFGTDQSQVQRYISGSSMRESRLGLLFNAICKIPMQLGILMIGVLMFVFYQFHTPPMFFDAIHKAQSPQIKDIEAQFAARRRELSYSLGAYVIARHQGDEARASQALQRARTLQQSSEALKDQARKTLPEKSKSQEADYVFITFILNELPHGVIGLLMAAFFAAALASKAAELNALGTCTTIDIYRRIFKDDSTDDHTVSMTRYFTAIWGLIAIAFALFAHMAENLIQAVNILGSIFYGVMLGLFIVGFFVKHIRGTAMFWAAIISQLAVIIMYFTLPISYLWYPLIGCALCLVLSAILEETSK